MATGETYQIESFRTFPIPFSYRAASEIRVYVDNVETSAFSFITQGAPRVEGQPNAIRLEDSVTGTEIRIERLTDIELGVDFREAAFSPAGVQSALEVLRDAIQDRLNTAGQLSQQAILDFLANLDIEGTLTRILNSGAVPLPAGPQGPGPSDIQLRDAFADYLRNNPLFNTPSLVIIRNISGAQTNPPSPDKVRYDLNSQGDPIVLSEYTHILVRTRAYVDGRIGTTQRIELNGLEESVAANPRGISTNAFVSLHFDLNTKELWAEFDSGVATDRYSQIDFLALGRDGINVDLSDHGTDAGARELIQQLQSQITILQTGQGVNYNRITANENAIAALQGMGGGGSSIDRAAIEDLIDAALQTSVTPEDLRLQSAINTITSDSRNALVNIRYQLNDPANNTVTLLVQTRDDQLNNRDGTPVILTLPRDQQITDNQTEIAQIRDLVRVLQEHGVTLPEQLQAFSTNLEIARETGDPVFSSVASKQLVDGHWRGAWEVRNVSSNTWGLTATSSPGATWTPNTDGSAFGVGRFRVPVVGTRALFGFRVLAVPSQGEVAHVLGYGAGGGAINGITFRGINGTVQMEFHNPATGGDNRVVTGYDVQFGDYIVIQPEPVGGSTIGTGDNLRFVVTVHRAGAAPIQLNDVGPFIGGALHFAYDFIIEGNINAFNTIFAENLAVASYAFDDGGYLTHAEQSALTAENVSEPTAWGIRVAGTSSSHEKYNASFEFAGNLFIVKEGALMVRKPDGSLEAFTSSGGPGTGTPGEQGEQGVKGDDGRVTVFAFRTVASGSAAPAMPVGGSYSAQHVFTPPSNWTAAPGDLGSRDLYLSTRIADPSGGVFVGSWSAPVRINGPQGVEGRVTRFIFRAVAKGTAAPSAPTGGTNQDHALVPPTDWYATAPRAFNAVSGADADKDLYATNGSFNPTTGNLVGGWYAPFLMTGPKGDTGEAGPKGDSGVVNVIAGATNPDNTNDGEDGDFYNNTANGTLWHKADGKWTQFVLSGGGGGGGTNSYLIRAWLRVPKSVQSVPASALNTAGVWNNSAASPAFTTKPGTSVGGGTVFDISDLPAGAATDANFNYHRFQRVFTVGESGVAASAWKYLGRWNHVPAHAKTYLISAYLRIGAGDIPLESALTTAGVWSDANKNFTTKPEENILDGVVYDDKDLPPVASRGSQHDFWEFQRYWFEGETSGTADDWSLIGKVDQDPASGGGGGVSISDRIDSAANLRAGTGVTVDGTLVPPIYDFDLTNALMVIGSGGNVRTYGAIAAQRTSDGEWVAFTNLSSYGITSLTDDGIALAGVNSPDSTASWYAVLKTGGSVPDSVSNADLPESGGSTTVAPSQRATRAAIDAAGGSPQPFRATLAFSVPKGNAAASISGGSYNRETGAYTFTIGQLNGGLYEPNGHPAIRAANRDYYNVQVEVSAANTVTFRGSNWAPNEPVSGGGGSVSNVAPNYVHLGTPNIEAATFTPSASGGSIDAGKSGIIAGQEKLTFSAANSLVTIPTLRFDTNAVTYPSTHLADGASVDASNGEITLPAGHWIVCASVRIRANTGIGDGGSRSWHKLGIIQGANLRHESSKYVRWGDVDANANQAGSSALSASFTNEGSISVTGSLISDGVQTTKIRLESYIQNRAANSNVIILGAHVHAYQLTQAG